MNVIGGGRTGRNNNYSHKKSLRKKDFTMESRIFHTVCKISIAVLIFNIFFDLYIGLPFAAILMLLVCVCVCYFYYISRFRNKQNLSIALFGGLSNLLFIINYYLNSGVEGPTILIFVLSIFMNIAIAPKKQYAFWISLNLIVVSALLIIDYCYPGLVKNTYHSRSDRYLDLAISYIITVALVLIVTIYIRKNYSLEKRKVELKNEELEHSNEAKNKLFSILAHDLRAPLNSIQSYLEVLSEMRLPDEEKKEIENELLSKTRNTTQMLSNLLIWTKNQMEGVNANLVPVNVAQCLASTFQIQQSLATEKHIILKNEIDEALFVIADPDMLQLVMRNLINNAIKFTPAGGEVKILSEVKNQQAILVVSDTGTGIPFETQENLFSLNTTPSYGTKNEKGVGLGLMLCKEFISLQHGQIWFLSEPGKGATFYVNLTLASQKLSMAS